MVKTKISSKKLTVVPSRIRKALGLKTGDKLEWLINPDGTITLLKVPRIPPPALKYKMREKVELDFSNWYWIYQNNDPFRPSFRFLLLALKEMGFGVLDHICKLAPDVENDVMRLFFVRRNFTEKPSDIICEVMVGFNKDGQPCAFNMIFNNVAGDIPDNVEDALEKRMIDTLERMFEEYSSRYGVNLKLGSGLSSEKSFTS